jgi:hypothetical protein
VIRALDWAVGGIKIRVRAKDLDAAREFLAESAEATRIERTNDREACPRCGGREQTSHVTTGKALAIFSWLVTGAPMWPVGRRLHCCDWGYIGRPTRAAESEAASLQPVVLSAKTRTTQDRSSDSGAVRTSASSLMQSFRTRSKPDRF